MRTTALLLGLIFGGSLLACGSLAPDAPSSAAPASTSTDVPPGVGTSKPNVGNPNVGGPSGPLDLTGSFDLTFTEVLVTVEATGGPNAPSGAAPPSRTTPSRIDIRKGASGFEAVFTARWGASTTLAVTEEAGALVLAGTAGVAAQGPGGYVYDAWRTLRLERNADGRLTGKVTADGDETVSAGDVVWNFELGGTGTLVKDATDPEAKIAIASLTGDVGLLPWESIGVRAAEPIDAAALQNGATLGGGGGALALAWDPLGSTTFGWAGETSLTARVADWTKVTSTSWSVSASGTIDLAGHHGKGATSAVTFLGLGPATSHIGFESDVLFAEPWGAFTAYGGGFTGAMDARCEGGSCLRLGPSSLQGCSVVNAGLAGVLTRGATGNVAVRYRILAKPEWTGENAPVVYSDVATLELAAQGASAVDTSIGGSSVALTALDAPIDGMTFATAWKTLEAPAPGSGKIGVALALGSSAQTRAHCGGGGGGLPFPGMDIEVLVDSIDAE